MKLKVTLASNAEGWDIMVNGQLETELAHNERVRVTGFVPKNTEEQREHARRLNIELFDAKVLPGFPPTELLAYPPDDLEIDILMMHSYGHDVGRQAQIITEAKQCKWVLVVHTISEELEKFLEKSAASSAALQETEHELQVKLCEKADLVLAVGPKVAEAYKAALQYCGKQDSVICLMPRVSEEFIGVRQGMENVGEKFRVLISGSFKYFKVKGCDIAAKAIRQLQDPSCHLILVIQPNDDKAKLEQAMVKEGINLNQMTVRNLSGATEAWHRLLCEVDLLVKPSRTEGFGMSGLRAISADLPILVSGNCGLGVALKKLPSGGKYVVDSEDPQVWADKIKELRALATKTCHSQAERLRMEYTEQFRWREQCNELVDTFFNMVQQDHGMEGI